MCRSKDNPECHCQTQITFLGDKILTGLKLAKQAKLAGQWAPVIYLPVSLALRLESNVPVSASWVLDSRVNDYTQLVFIYLHFFLHGIMPFFQKFHYFLIFYLGFLSVLNIFCKFLTKALCSLSILLVFLESHLQAPLENDSFNWRLSLFWQEYLVLNTLCPSTHNMLIKATTFFNKGFFDH